MGCKGRPTLGLVQLSLGNTAPYLSIAARMALFRAGRWYFGASSWLGSAPASSGIKIESASIH